jgi:hypothetical protein
MRLLATVYPFLLLRGLLLLELFLMRKNGGAFENVSYSEDSLMDGIVKLSFMCKCNKEFDSKSLLNKFYCENSHQ